MIDSELNPVGYSLLCQAIITSAIQENDIAFLSSELGEIVKEIAVRHNNYNLDAILPKVTSLPNRNSKKYDSEVLRREVYEYTIDELASRYHASEKNIRSALAKRHIAWGKNLNKVIICENGQLEFCF